MLAENEKWDELIEVEKERAQALVQISEVVTTTTTETDLAELIQKIITTDAKTQVLVNAWMSELTALMGSMQSQRKLQQVYGNN